MADENQTAEAAQQSAQAEPKFALQRIYLKDLSFETPQGFKAFQKQWQPTVSQDINTKTSKAGENQYEVALRITITVKHESETIYLIEVEQAGLFQVEGIENNHLAQVLNSTCPEILFPYAREAIDNTLMKGTFPPLMMPPINFDALFAAAVQQAQKQAQQAGEAAPTVQ